MDESLARIAALLGERNRVDASIAKVIDRPVTAGHLGEWIASQIFDIALAESAANQGFDGRFRSGSLRGCTVNIKWYMKRTGLLDTTEFPDLDYYLVLTGPCVAIWVIARHFPALVHPSRVLARGASSPRRASRPGS